MVSGRLVESGDQVPVNVQSGFDRGMSHPGLDRLWMLAGSDQERSVAVPQIVEAESPKAVSGLSPF